MPPWIMCDDAADAPLTKSDALGERDVDALHRQVTESGEAVDAAAHDEHIGIGTCGERLVTLPCLRHVRPLAHRSSPGPRASARP